MTALDFTEEDLLANRSGRISPAQLGKIKKMEILKFWLGFVLTLIFLSLTALAFYWFIFDMEIPAKDGKPVPRLLFLGIGTGSFVLMIVFFLVMRLSRRHIKLLSGEDAVLVIEAPYAGIEYGTSGRAFLPFLKVKGVALANIASFQKNVFQAGASYRFYYSRNNRSLLSLEKVGT